MEREVIKIGDYVHVYNRGNRKMPIVYDERDRWRFIKNLRFFNEELEVTSLLKRLNASSSSLRAALEKSAKTVFDFELPISWPDPQPLVKILCFFLAPNHFHLLLREIRAGGISKLMEKLGTGFTMYTNLKYKEVGRLFQGPYQRKVISGIRYLQYLSVYIQVFNAFELYAGGFEAALKNFNKAFEFAMSYEFGSLPDFLGKRDLGIIEKDIFEEIFPSLQVYKKITYDCLIRKDLRGVLGKLAIDNIDKDSP